MDVMVQDRHKGAKSNKMQRVKRCKGTRHGHGGARHGCEGTRHGHKGKRV